VNAAAQEHDPNSVLNYFRKLINLRKNDLTLVYGKYTLLDKDNPDVYAYSRTLNKETIIVLLNFKNKMSSYNIKIKSEHAVILANNYPVPHNGNLLRPYEAVVYKMIAE
jgi:oligo-1,6-glucosidase